MALNFPDTPSVGQLFPSPAVVGVPVYRWDGTKWTTQGSAIDAIPSGTKMLFWQAAAPTGWTQDTTQNDKALRVVSGVGGVAGGTNSFSTVMAQSVVGNHTLTLGETPTGITAPWSSTLSFYPSGTSNYSFPVVGSNAWYPNTYQQFAGGYTTPYTPAAGSAVVNTNVVSGGAGATATSNNTGGGAHNHPITMAIQYIDIIVASKN